MSVLAGHGDLRPKEIFGFDGSGNAMVDYGDEGTKKYSLYVMPGGAVKAMPVDQNSGSSIDQIGERLVPTKALRMRGIDQAE